MEQKLSKLLRSSKTFLLSGRFFLSHLPFVRYPFSHTSPLPPPPLSVPFSGISSPAFILSRLAIRLREREIYGRSWTFTYGARMGYFSDHYFRSTTAAADCTPFDPTPSASLHLLRSRGEGGRRIQFQIHYILNVSWYVVRYLFTSAAFHSATHSIRK